MERLFKHMGVLVERLMYAGVFLCNIQFLKCSWKPWPATLNHDLFNKSNETERMLYEESRKMFKYTIYSNNPMCELLCKKVL